MEAFEQYKLKNGLTVVLHGEIPQSVVAMHLWVNSGSAHESPQQAGIAHCIEHLLFKGSKTRSAKALNHAVEAHGGILNAFTSFDNTGFHLTLPSRHLTFGLDVLRDLLLSPRFAAKDFATERGVILEELHEELDNPEAMLGHRLFAKAYGQHPYERPIIGTPRSLKSLNMTTIRRFYAQHYHPANMILALAGDFSPQQVRAGIEKRFGKTRPQALPPITITHPGGAAPKFQLDWLRMGENQYALELSFNVPPISHPHTAALDLLSTILGGSEHSRLYQRLCVKGNRVRAVDAHCFSAKHGGLFLVRAVLNRHDYQPIFQAILKELKRLRQELVTPRELELAKLSIERDLLFEGQTSDGIAHNLAFYESTIGDAVWGSHYFDTVMACTANELRRTAEQYFQPEALTVVGLSPKKQPGPGQRHRWQKLAAETFTHRESRQRIRAGHKVVKRRLAPHLHLLHRHIPDSQVTSLNLAIPGGLLQESEALSGIGNLALTLLSKGTRQKNERQLSQALTDIGAEFDASVGRSRIGLQLDLPTRHFAKGVALVGEMLQSWKVSEALFRRERNFTIRELAAQVDHHELQGFNKMMLKLFPQHPYGFNPLGNSATLKSLSLKGVRQFYQQKLLALPWSIAVVGGIDEAALTRLVNRHLRHPRQVEQAPKGRAPATQTGEIFETIGGKQAYIYQGYQTCSLYHRDWAAFDVLSGVLTGFGGGTLYHRLREELGLAYTVQCYAYSGSTSGYFSFYINTAPANIKRVQREIHQAISQLQNHGVASRHLERAKNFLLGAYLSDLQRTSAQAHHLATYHQYGLGSDLDFYSEAIRGVSAKQLQRIAQNFLRPEQAVSVTLAPSRS